MSLASALSSACASTQAGPIMGAQGACSTSAAGGTDPPRRTRPPRPARATRHISASVTSSPHSAADA
eukprot:916288-Prorocentrum_minimum.AAC.1